MIAAIVLAATAAAMPIGHPAADPGAAGADSPIAFDWLDDVVDDIDDTEDNVDEANKIVRRSGSAALTADDRSAVAARLDAAVERIGRILDPGQYPSLDAPGAILADIQPQTLAEYAKQCQILALDAELEVYNGGPAFDHTYVASCLRTIEYLITRETPHNYRTMADIE